MLYTRIELEVIGKPDSRSWKNDEGKTVNTFKLNVAQDDGKNTATMKCPEDVYNQVRRGDVVEFQCSYAEYGDRVDFRIVAVNRYLNTTPAPVGSAASAPASPAAGAGQSTKK